MLEYLFETETTIPAPRQSVFDFFSDASNLERLTPPSLRFQILTPLPVRMAEGTLIDYRIVLRGLRLGWRTRICRWRPPFEFIDEQVKGPYRRWIHHHSFEEKSAGMTFMRDRVRYALPFGALGALALPFIRAELRAIFEFRRKMILVIFSRD